MNAMQKVAWTEFMVSMTAAAIATALYPWLGNGAAGAFGLLGLVACGAWFLRGRDKRTIVDERDRAIEQKAIRWGMGAAWQLSFMTLIAVVMWNSSQGRHSVSHAFLTWLIWIQFAVCYGVKGLVGILSYRSAASAA